MELIKSNKMKLGIGILIIIVSVLAVLYGIHLANLNYEVEVIEEIRYYVLVKEEKKGVISNDGTILLEPEYEQIMIPNPSKPVFIAYIEEGNTKVFNDKKEEILSNFHQVMPIETKGIVSTSPYEKNILQYEENGKYGIVSLEGKKVENAVYDSIEGLEYKEGNLLVKKDQKYGVVNNKGYILVPIQYDTILADNYYSEKQEYKKSGFIVGKKTQDGYRYGYIKANGKTILEVNYNEIYRITDILEDNHVYLISTQNGQLGVSKDGKEVLPHTYQEIEYNSLNDCFIVKKGEKVGAYTRTGKEILPVQYQEITISGIYLQAKNQEETILFNAKGEKVNSENQVSKIPTSNAQYFIVANKENLYGIVNEKDELVIPNEYTYIEYLRKDFFIVCNKNGKYGVLLASGKSAVDLNYDGIQILRDTNLLQVMNGEETYLYDGEMKRIYEGKNVTIHIEDEKVKVLTKEKTEYFDKEGKKLTIEQVYPNNTLYSKQKDGKYGFVNKQGEVKVDYLYERVTEFNSAGYAGIYQNGKWGIINQEGNMVVQPIFVLEELEPNFLDQYYKVDTGFGTVYYTNQIPKEG